MTSKYLFQDIIDRKISWYLFEKCNPGRARYLNMIMIIFSGRHGFVKFCVERYWFMLGKYKKLKQSYDLFDIMPFKINNNNFWIDIVAKFRSGVPIIILDGKQKATTRKKVYMLGLYYGYSHTITNQYQREKLQNRHGNMLYTEYKIEDRTYTMGEINKLRLNLPIMKLHGCDIDSETERIWIETDKLDNNGNKLYICDFKNLGCKRGIIWNSPGVITFIKQI